MADYDFAERLQFSKDNRLDSDTATIQAMLPGVESVTLADREEERRGIDYIATLRSGARVNIDLKLRDTGCSQFWRDGPELALEDWSVCYTHTGWTLDESKDTDLIFFVFDPSDATECYLVSFQLLRAAFRRNHASWQRKYFDAFQQSNGWQSHCIFVPVDVVLDAIRDISIGQYTA